MFCKPFQVTNNFSENNRKRNFPPITVYSNGTPCSAYEIGRIQNRKKHRAHTHIADKLKTKLAAFITTGPRSIAIKSFILGVL